MQQKIIDRYRPDHYVNESKLVTVRRHLLVTVRGSSPDSDCQSVIT